MPSEISLSPRVKITAQFHFHGTPRVAKFRETESGKVAPRHWMEKWTSLPDESSFSFRKDGLGEMDVAMVIQYMKALNIAKLCPYNG